VADGTRRHALADARRGETLLKPQKLFGSLHGHRIAWDEAVSTSQLALVANADVAWAARTAVQRFGPVLDGKPGKTLAGQT